MYSFVTVAHALDESLLRIQARSMPKYAAPTLVGEIVIIENFAPGKRAEWRDKLKAEYGHLAPLVRFFDGATLCQMPQASGWWTQQVLKMLAARIVRFPRYVVLDAKNHLVRPLQQDFLEVNGRIRTRRYGYQNHPLRSALERALAYCDVPLGKHLDLFTPTATPFTMDRADVLEVIQFVERKEGKPFAQAFIDRQLTEFFLYAARLVKLGRLEQVHDFGQIPCPVVWDEQVTPARLLPLIREADERGAPVFAVHRRGIPNMDPIAREILGQFWRRRGLFRSTADAVAELERMGRVLA